MNIDPVRRIAILLADDEESVSSVVSFFLRNAGHEVDRARDGIEALSKLRGAPGKYQVLITDHDMPNASGLELVEKLSDIGFRGKVVVFSGYLTPEIQRCYRGLGADKLVHKPFDMVGLRKVVEDLSLEMEARTIEENEADFHFERGRGRCASGSA